MNIEKKEISELFLKYGKDILLDNIKREDKDYKISIKEKISIIFFLLIFSLQNKPLILIQKNIKCIYYLPSSIINRKKNIITIYQKDAEDFSNYMTISLLHHLKRARVGQRKHFIDKNNPDLYRIWQSSFYQFSFDKNQMQMMMKKIETELFIKKELTFLDINIKIIKNKNGYFQSLID